MNGFYGRLVEVLQAHGWTFKRAGKGSHEMWTNGRWSVTVPKTSASRHTANEVLKQAKIPHKF